jgi:transcriptional regulator
MSVQIKGELRFLDEKELIKILQKTSLHFESGDRNSPTAYDNLSEEYVSRLKKAIVAFEIEIREIDNVFKLSQNRDRESYLNIIENLKNEETNAKQIAEEMEKRAQTLFKDPS